MKFVTLKSRGGDYLVVAQNVAWLRSYEESPDENRHYRKRRDPGGRKRRGNRRKDPRKRECGTSDARTSAKPRLPSQLLESASSDMTAETSRFGKEGAARHW